MTLAHIIGLWLLPSLLLLARAIYLSRIEAAYDEGYEACAEDVEHDAIDQLHRDLEKFVRESA